MTPNSSVFVARRPGHLAIRACSADARMLRRVYIVLTVALNIAVLFVREETRRRAEYQTYACSMHWKSGLGTRKACRIATSAIRC